jgi:outer membrane lipoprotein carrier protein
MGSGKYSPRRRRIWTRRLPIFGSVIAIGLAAANPALADAAGMAAGRDTLDQFLAQAHTLTADFRQALWSADERLLESAAGSFALQRPNHFRWRYEAPLQQLIIADGARLWMYDVELNQVTVAPLDSPSASSPAMLLSGDEAARESFEVTDGFLLDGVQWVRLDPRLGDTDFQSVLIGFREGVLANLEMTDGLNQVTRIEFVNVAVNADLESELFVFVPPADASLIGDP